MKSLIQVADLNSSAVLTPERASPDLKKIFFHFCSVEKPEIIQKYLSVPVACSQQGEVCKFQFKQWLQLKSTMALTRL